MVGANPELSEASSSPGIPSAVPSATARRQFARRVQNGLAIVAKQAPVR